jgi:GT2 family glycosyltransferase
MTKTSIIIPTINRPNDLYNAINSILDQSILPDELIIIDQSKDSRSKNISRSLFSDRNYASFIYVHDQSICGLVAAKRHGVALATGELIFFLEDDILLSKNYISEILLGFDQLNKMVGCCGIISNHPPKSHFQSLLFNIFHTGIFKDIRFNFFKDMDSQGKSLALVLSDKLSGGVSAWKREVFAHVDFDVSNGFHMLEDIDFSTRVSNNYSNQLYINPNAKLTHHFSPVGRGNLLSQKRRKANECIVFYKKRKSQSWSLLSIIWLLVGMLMQSLLESVHVKSFDPLIGCLLGIKDGISYNLVISRQAL